VLEKLKDSGSKFNGISIEGVTDKLFSPETHVRKEVIGGFVNWLITSVKIKMLTEFDSPLLRYRASFCGGPAKVCSHAWTAYDWTMPL
jgi:dGTPase